MRSFSILFSVLLAFAATSYASPEAVSDTIEVRRERNSTDNAGMNANPVRRQCAQIRKLTSLTSLASNQTRLDALVSSGRMTTQRADEIKAKAADANTRLQMLTSNSTLTTECATINANRAMKQQCKQMQRMQRLANLASNATALDAFAASRGMNATAVDALRARLQRLETNLKQNQANTTLTTFCAQMKQGNRNSENSNGTTDSGAAASASGDPAQAATNGAGALQVTSLVVVSIFAGASALLL